MVGRLPRRPQDGQAAENEKMGPLMATPGTFRRATLLLPVEFVRAVGAKGKNQDSCGFEADFVLGAIWGHCGGNVGAVLYDEVDSFTHLFMFILCTNPRRIQRTPSVSRCPQSYGYPNQAGV